MTFTSTRGGEEVFTFREAILQGLAPDGGLLHPTSTPDLRDVFNALASEISFSRMAERVFLSLLASEVPEKSVSRIVERAFPFSPVLTPLHDGILLLELFHGPSFAFKDFGACFLASCIEEFFEGEGEEAVVLVATSGDTGSAVARAFYKKRNVRVVILYPSGRISTLQEKQLTVLGENITSLEVEGSFDDCQRIVKEAFGDEELNRRLKLTSANSINLGRLIPQALYYIFAYLRTGEREGPVFVVPSGNFGNLTAGVYAWSWGLPVRRFIAATNSNDVVPEYLDTGIFKARPSVSTLSNAMDVGNPSNLERLLAVFNGQWSGVRGLIGGEVVTDEETLETIARVRHRNGIFIDPHTAVGCMAAERLQKEQTGKVVVLSTAHPAKFTETVFKATGENPALPAALEKIMHLPKLSLKIDNSLPALKKVLL